MKAMTMRDAKALQRVYQRRGCVTWLVYNIFAGEEHLGFQWSVVVLDEDGQHTLNHRKERVGGTRTIRI